MNHKITRLRNQFVLPNEIFHLGLSTGEIAVYAFLVRCEDRKNYTCHPSYATIGEAVGMSRNTVGKYVALLESKRLIETEPTEVTSADGKKHNGNLRYKILPVQDVIEARFMRELHKAQTAMKLQEYDQNHAK